MRTISRHWPSDAPRGDVQAKCDYCGVRWRRSQLRMDRAGMLACPDEGYGRDAVTLAEGNAALSARRGPVMVPPGGGNYSIAPDPTYVTVDAFAGRTPSGQALVPEPQAIFGNSLTIWWRPDPQVTQLSGNLVSRLNGKVGSNLDTADINTVAGAVPQASWPTYLPTGGPNGTPVISFQGSLGQRLNSHIDSLPTGSDVCWFVVAKIPNPATAGKCASWRVGNSGDFGGEIVPTATVYMYTVGPFVGRGISTPAITGSTFQNFIVAGPESSPPDLASSSVLDGCVGAANGGGQAHDFVLAEWCWLNAVPGQAKIDAWNAYVAQRYGL